MYVLVYFFKSQSKQIQNSCLFVCVWGGGGGEGAGEEMDMEVAGYYINAYAKLV